MFSLFISTSLYFVPQYKPLPGVAHLKYRRLQNTKMADIKHSQQVGSIFVFQTNYVSITNKKRNKPKFRIKIQTMSSK